VVGEGRDVGGGGAGFKNRAEVAENGAENQKASGCPGFGPLLMDFGTFASVASVA